jgi:hypothetical protein
MRRLLILLFFVVALDAAGDRTRAAQEVFDLREPFAIELPELNTGLLRAKHITDVPIPPGSVVTRFRLWVVNPYASLVGYRIYAELFGPSRQGKALSIVGMKQSGKYGNFFDVDLRQKPDIRLNSGKNIIEVRATESVSQITYRCSFVLLAGVADVLRPECDPGDAAIRVDRWLTPLDPAIPLKDRTAPEITLAEPQASIASSAEPIKVRVAGTAVDDSGIVVAVSANAQVVAVPAPPGKKSKESKKQDKTASPDPLVNQLVFNQTVTLPPHTFALLIEAHDRAGNRTRITIPVVDRNCGAAIAASDSGVRKFALLVGVSKYKYNERNLNNLLYADKDAEAMQEWLRTSTGGGFKERDIVCLLNEEATLAAVELKINGFLQAAGPNDLIYLFLAGHGSPDPYDSQNLYFLLHDSKVNDLPNTAFPMKKLGEFLDKQKKSVRLVAFIDTCHSAGISGSSLVKPPRQPQSEQDVRGVGVKKSKDGAKPAPVPTAPAPQPPPQMPAFNFYAGELFKQRGWMVISSAGMDELAEEGSQWDGHGVFTWALLKGLKGKADEDRDCLVNAGELSRYVSQIVTDVTKGRQNPQTLAGGNENLVMAALPNCKR